MTHMNVDLLEVQKLAKITIVLVKIMQNCQVL